MKKVYELRFKTKNNDEHNLIYAYKKRAMEDSQTLYKKGIMHPLGEIINSFVIERTLF